VRSADSLPVPGPVRFDGGVTTGDALFAALVEQLADRPGVTRPEPGRRAFGASALKVDGSIFAMLHGERLVVKLPRQRVSALVDAGTGAPFDSGKGRPMKEWVGIPAGDDGLWRTLAEEALEFVGRHPRH
jgi:hypothetical protein